MKFAFADNQFSFQTLRILGSAAARLADLGEVVRTAERIESLAASCGEPRPSACLLAQQRIFDWLEETIEDG